jgi:hypothetical protein
VPEIKIKNCRMRKRASRNGMKHPLQQFQKIQKFQKKKIVTM